MRRILGSNTEHFAEIATKYEEELAFAKFALSLPQFKGKDLFWLLKEAKIVMKLEAKKAENDKKGIVKRTLNKII